LGRLLHDRTAEAIASPISQLPRVVATIVPFDVERILSGAPIVIEKKEKKISTVAPIKSSPIVTQQGQISHYAEDVTAISSVQWRKRAQVQGKVASIKTAPSRSAPVLEIELWDESGGITLQFLGRREIAGLEVGAELRAEGMVGEENGSLKILNPSYELLA
jgi:RecG-like helicase